MNKALFLDRDGIVNVEIDYLYKKEDFVFVDGILDLCRHYQSLGYLIIVVTNQSGIARGYYTEEQYQVLTEWMIEQFLQEGIVISKVYHCPHHPDISGECLCRKPNPNMILDAAALFEIDLTQSLLIGDNERDIEAALNAGVPQSYLLSSNQYIDSRASKVVKSLDDIWR